MVEAHLDSALSSAGYVSGGLNALHVVCIERLRLIM